MLCYSTHVYPSYNFLLRRDLYACRKKKHARYKRILLKLSGEALQGDENFGIDPKVLNRMALEVGQLVGIGVQVGIVIGGGNLFRGAALSAAGMDQ